MRDRQFYHEAWGNSSQRQFYSYFPRQPRISNLKLTEQRIQQMASLTWQLYTDCDDIVELKSLCPELGALNLQFRKTEEYIAQAVLDRPMQDMLLNVVDGCFAILKDLQMQIQEHQGVENAAHQSWNDVVWSENQIEWRVGRLGIYSKGLSSMNANFQRCFSSFPLYY
jgi:hypothetical protein